MDALCKRFNVDLSRRFKHNAVLDCELLREVYAYLLGAKEPKLSFNSPVEQISNSTKVLKYSKKIVKPSIDEPKKPQFIFKERVKKIISNFFLIYKVS